MKFERKLIEVIIKENLLLNVRGMTKHLTIKL